uniref:AAA+ ATPase domain-containing protein n=1 Tax=mine drainage metagenome TaxID=410659 RepID=E6PBZ7_9ZZZZ
MTELEKFVDRKRLPIAFLTKKGVEETEAGIRFTNGDARTRIRPHADSHKTLWVKGDNRPMRIYGYDRVERMALHIKTVLIVEGESDSLSAWFHKRPALGVPGSSLYEKLKLEDASPFDRVVVIREPGEAGRKFAVNVPKRLRELCYAGSVVIVDLPTKDLSDLHVECVENETEFDRMLDAAIENAKAPEIPADGSGERPERSLFTVRLDTVQPERVEWLWRARIPLSKVSLLVGDPGSGKSFASLALAGAVTAGIALPDSDAAEPANVVAYNAEDGLEDTVRPRAELCGVELSRFHAIEGMRDADGRPRPFGLSDIQRLAEFMEKLGDVRLVIIDPIASLLAGVDSHRDTEVRASLQVLVELAKQTRAAVLVIMHLRKAGAERAVYRVGGSIAFAGLARSILLAGINPEDGRRAIVPIKQNLASPVDPIEYRLDAEGRFWWEKAAPELTADRLLAGQSTRPTSAVDAASQFLADCLADGERAADEVRRLANEVGISDSTLRRAKAALKVRADRTGFAKEGRWFWSLPIDVHNDAIDAQASRLSAYGDSMSIYAGSAPEHAELSDRSKLCCRCKTLGLAYDMGDGTWLCRNCRDEAA